MFHCRCIVLDILLLPNHVITGNVSMSQCQTVIRYYIVMHLGHFVCLLRDLGNPSGPYWLIQYKSNLPRPISFRFYAQILTSSLPATAYRLTA